MKIVLLAATGQAGRSVLSELLSRGHQVTAVARSPGKLPPSINTIRDDLSNADRIAEIIAGADAVISAFGPSKNDARFFSDVSYTDQLLDVTIRAITAVRMTGVSRLIVVGGVGSLWYSPGLTVLESGHWPDNLAPIATSHMKTLAALKASDINWTYFSPPMLIEPGVRTGVFRLGGDDLMVDAVGMSWVSFEDYAMALVDELETPQQEKSRFTIGY
jgi:putative NADH-flavin reductase